MDVKLRQRSIVTAAVAVLLAAPIARGVERDSLLEEVRSLRRDLHAVAVAAQRIQLLVFRAHMQTEIVRRAKARHDAVKQTLGYLEFEVKQALESIQKMEEQIRSESDRQRKQAIESVLESVKARHKGNAESMAMQQADATEAERQYQSEQAKLEDLQSRLDQLERQLEGLSASLVR